MDGRGLEQVIPDASSMEPNCTKVRSSKGGPAWIESNAEGGNPERASPNADEARSTHKKALGGKMKPK